MTDWNNCNTNWKGNATPWGLLFWKWVGLEIRSYVILYRLKWQWQRHAYDIIRPKQFCGRRNLDYRRQALACLSELLNPLKRHISIGVFIVYIDAGSPVLYIPSKSRDLADENNKILTEWKWFETTVLQ